MSPPRRLLRAKPNRPEDRVADAWAGFAMRLQTPGPTGQIQTLLTTPQVWLASRMVKAGRHASTATSSSRASAIKRP